MWHTMTTTIVPLCSLTTSTAYTLARPDPWGRLIVAYHEPIAQQPALCRWCTFNFCMGGKYGGQRVLQKGMPPLHTHNVHNLISDKVAFEMLATQFRTLIEGSRLHPRQGHVVTILCSHKRGRHGVSRLEDEEVWRMCHRGRGCLLGGRTQYEE